MENYCMYCNDRHQEGLAYCPRALHEETTGPGSGKALYAEYSRRHPPGDGSVWVSWEGLRPELALLWDAMAAFGRDYASLRKVVRRMAGAQGPPSRDDPVVPKWYADHIGGKLEGIEAKLDWIGDALSKDYNKRFGPKAE